MRLLSPFELAGKLLNLSAAGLILATQFHMLAQIRTRGFVGMLILLAGSLVIVTGNFAGTPAVAAALCYGIVEVLLSLLVAFCWRRSAK